MILLGKDIVKLFFVSFICIMFVKVENLLYLVCEIVVGCIIFRGKNFFGGMWMKGFVLVFKLICIFFFFMRDKYG